MSIIYGHQVFYPAHNKECIKNLILNTFIYFIFSNYIYLSKRFIVK